MKKSDIQVTMPMTTYEEMELLKNELISLKKELADCFFTETKDILNFDAAKSLSIAKKFIKYQDKNKDIKIII